MALVVRSVGGSLVVVITFVMVAAARIGMGMMLNESRLYRRAVARAMAANARKRLNQQQARHQD
jgi:hypothetical protein